jgi:hypothetical protein
MIGLKHESYTRIMMRTHTSKLMRAERGGKREGEGEPEVRSGPGLNEQVVRSFEIENSGKLSFKSG